MPSTPPFRPPWGVTPRQAAALQSEWAHLVVTRNDLPEIRRVAGIDVGFEDHGRIARAAVAVLTFPGLTLAESVVHRAPTAFPYVPGLLSFREIPPVLEALERLEHPPDLLVCDGQGRAHPRRFGLACHLGVLTGLPSIGAAKSRLIGTHGEPGPERGDVAWLHDHDEIIGAVLRTRRNVRPLFVSIGHRIDLPTAVDWTLRVTPRYRLPETTRHAHRLASGP